MKLRERTCRDCGRIWSDEVEEVLCPKCDSKNVDSGPVRYVGEEEPQDWFFTFGIGQENAGKYTVIHGTCDSTREEMFRRYGDRWSFQYPSAEAAGVEEWRLQCLS